MDFWRLNDNTEEMQGYWNPPRPTVVAAPVFPTSSNAVTDMVAVKEEPEERDFQQEEAAVVHYGGGYHGYDRRDNVQAVVATGTGPGSGHSESTVCFGELADQFLVNGNMNRSLALVPLEEPTNKRQRLDTSVSSCGTIDLDSDSDGEEVYDYNVRTPRQSSSQQQMKQRTDQRPPPEVIGSSAKPDPASDDPATRLVKYQHNFNKLRYLYDKLKQANAELKKRQDDKVAAMEGVEVKRLQAELGEKSAQLQIAQGKIGSLEKEMASFHAERTNVADLLHDNWQLTKRVKCLEIALKDAYTDQMTIFNCHKKLLEKSSHSLQSILSGGGGNVTGGAQDSEAEAVCGKKSEMPATSATTTMMSIKPSACRPSDPRRPRKTD